MLLKILIDVLSAYLCSASFNTKNPVHIELEVEHRTSVTHFTDHKRRTAPSHGFCHAQKLFTYLQIFGEGGNHLEKKKYLASQHTEQYFAVQF